MNNFKASKTPPSTTTIIPKGDIAASNHYFALRDIEQLQDVVADKFGPTFVLLDTYTFTENSTRLLPLSSSLSYLANKTAVFDNLQQSIIHMVNYVMTIAKLFWIKRTLMPLKMKNNPTG